MPVGMCDALALRSRPIPIIEMLRPYSLGLCGPIGQMQCYVRRRSRQEQLLPVVTGVFTSGFWLPQDCRLWQVTSRSSAATDGSGGGQPAVIEPRQHRKPLQIIVLFQTFVLQQPHQFFRAAIDHTTTLLLQKRAGG